jgi:hypothetical protein
VPAGIAHDVLERNPVGNGQNDFVAVIDQNLNRIEERVFAAGRSDRFLAAVVPATAVYFVKLP